MRTTRAEVLRKSFNEGRPAHSSADRLVAVQLRRSVGCSRMRACRVRLDRLILNRRVPNRYQSNPDIDSRSWLDPHYTMDQSFPLFPRFGSRRRSILAFFSSSSASTIGYLFTLEMVISKTGDCTKSMPAIPTLPCISTCYESPCEPFIANGTTAKIDSDCRNDLPCRRTKKMARIGYALGILRVMRVNCGICRRSYAQNRKRLTMCLGGAREGTRFETSYKLTKDAADGCSVGQWTASRSIPCTRLGLHQDLTLRCRDGSDPISAPRAIRNLARICSTHLCSESRSP